MVDLSAMSEASARRLLEARAGTRTCIHYVADRAGRVVFADRPSPARRRALLALAGFALAVTLAGCGRAPTSAPEWPDDSVLDPELATMARIGDVGVVVIDVLTGKPIADVPIRVRSSRGDEIGAEHTDDRGTREFEQLPPDTYAVTIVAGLAEATEHLHLRGGTRVEVTFWINPYTASKYEHWQDEGSEHEQLTGDYAGDLVERPSRRHRRRAG